MIRNIIWDVDGTLFDTYPAIARAFRQAVNDCGADAPLEWISDAARVSLGHCTTVLAERCDLDPDDLGQRFNAFYDRVGPQDQPPFAGVVEVCAYIQSLGGQNGIVTHRGSQSTRQLLRAYGMQGYFSGIISRDDGYPKKPNPAAFEAIIVRLGLVKAETLAVGDREIDIQSGQAAGVITCLFDPTRGPSATDLRIESFDLLLAYLQTRAA